MKEDAAVDDLSADLLIQKARPECPADLHVLRERSWMTTCAPECPEDAVARFRDEDPIARYLDARLGQIEPGLLKGHVVAAMHLDGDLLASLHVAPELRGRGFGSATMDVAEARGARRLEVRAFNLPAIRFYERRGWKRTRTYEGLELGTPMPTHEYRK